MLSRRRLVLKASLSEVKVPLDAAPHPSLIRPSFLSQNNGRQKSERGYGTDYLARITYPHLVEISDDNVANACNHPKG